MMMRGKREKKGRHREIDRKFKMRTRRPLLTEQREIEGEILRDERERVCVIERESLIKIEMSTRRPPDRTERYRGRDIKG